MISGRHATSVYLFLLLLGAATASAAGTDVGRILAAVAVESSGEVPFVERRTLSLLDQVFELRGSLRFTQPARLEKRVTSPYSEQLVVDGRQVVISRADSAPVHVSLDDAPALDALVEGFRATLAGDGTRLSAYYAITPEGSDASWALHLKPTSDRLARVVESISIEGQYGRIARFTIRERGGDHSVLELGR